MDATFVRRVLAAFEAGEIREQLMWFIEGEDIRFSVDVSDVFIWACSDAEEITPENIGVLESSIADAGDSAGEGYRGMAGELFAARVRGCRPQGAAYSYYPRQFWHLFDACGPERETGLGNPCRPGAYRAGPYSDEALDGAVGPLRFDGGARDEAPDAEPEVKMPKTPSR